MLTNPPRLSGLRLEPAVSEEVVLVTAPGARGIQPFYTVAELCRTPLLVTSGIRTVIDEQLRKLGLKLAPGIELDSVEGIRRMVVKGLAPTLMPASAFQDDIRAGRLDAFHIADAKLHRLLMIASPAASRQPHHTGHAAGHRRAGEAVCHAVRRRRVQPAAARAKPFGQRPGPQGRTAARLGLSRLHVLFFI